MTPKAAALPSGGGVPSCSPLATYRLIVAVPVAIHSSSYPSVGLSCKRAREPSGEMACRWRCSAGHYCHFSHALCRLKRGPFGMDDSFVDDSFDALPQCILAPG